MTITLDISDKIHGTVDWLSKATSVKLGQLRNKRALWLKNHEATMCLLACQDPYDVKGDGYSDPTAWVVVSPCGSDMRPSLDFPTTDACFSSIQAIAEAAIASVKVIDEEEVPLTFTLVRK